MDGLGDRIVAALGGRGATDFHLAAFCAALENGGWPQLTWVPDNMMPDAISEGEGGVSVRLFNLLTTHQLTRRRRLQLLSRDEFARLCGLGTIMATELLKCYSVWSIEPRAKEQSITARAADLYGSILEVPITVALSIVFSKKKYNIANYVDICGAISVAGIKTIGELMLWFSQRPDIPNVSADDCNKLRYWLQANIFYR